MLDNTTLEQTVEAFANNDMNVAKCAKALFITRNALKYRLSVIKKRTKKDPRNFCNLAELLGYEKKKIFEYNPEEFDAEQEMCNFCRDWRLGGDCKKCKEAP